MRLFLNSKKIKNMIHICDDELLLLTRKRKEITKYLKSMGNKYFDFIDYDNNVLNELSQIFTCQRNSGSKKYCKTSDNEMNLFLIPKQHLITKEDNKEIYYERLADEIVRYKNIKLFMFYPDQYLSSGLEEYKLNMNEFIIPRSMLLKGEYFKDIEYNKNEMFGESYEFLQTNENEPLEWEKQYEEVI